MRKSKVIRIYDDEEKLIKKQCGKCGEIKEVNDFSRDKGKSDGLSCHCKDCCIEYQKTYRKDNKEVMLENKKEYYKKNKSDILEYQKKYRQDNVDKIKDYRDKYYEDNREGILEQKKEYRLKNIDKFKEKDKNYYEENKDKILKRNRNYQKQLRINRKEESVNKIYENYTKNNYPNSDIQYGIIYGVYNKVTNRWYIGQTTKDFKSRYEGDFFKYRIHCQRSHMNDEKELLLKNDYYIYGEESFEIYEILDVAFSPMELDEKEVYYIDYYKAYDEGYNSNRGYINGRQTLYDTWIKENKSKGEIE